MTKQRSLGMRLATGLAVLTCITAAHALAAEFRKVIDGVGYVRVGGSENNVYVVGPITNAAM